MNIAFVPHDVLHAISQHVVSAPWAPADEKQVQSMINVPMPFDWVDSPTILSISQVCKHWRAVALATSVYWSTIVIDADGDEDNIPHQAMRIQTYLTRSRNRPLSIIIINMLPVNYDLLDSVIQLLSKCLTRATTVQARFIEADVGNAIMGNLIIAPILTRLALWHMRASEAEILGIDAEGASVMRFLPSSFLTRAPHLRSIQGRGLPHPAFSDGPLHLPSVEEFTWDDSPCSVGALRDHSFLLETFKNVTKLVLLPNSSIGNVIPEKRVVFSSLEYLEISCTAARVLFKPPGWMEIPKLHTVCYHIEAMVQERSHVAIHYLADVFLHLPTAPKRLILNGFGVSGLGGMGVESFPASHVRCFQTLTLFEFISSLEFHRCFFEFTPTWNKAWLLGEDDGWDNLFGTVFGVYGDGEFKHDAKVDLAQTMESVSSFLSNTLKQDESTGMRLLDPFMPRLIKLSFTDCVFLDQKGAMDFADVLSLRQGLVERMRDSSCTLESISLHHMNDPVAGEFADRLKGSVSMKGVSIEHNGAQMAESDVRACRI